MILDGTQPASIAAAARAVRSGALLGLPTETVYGLGADADNATNLEAIAAKLLTAAGTPMGDVEVTASDNVLTFTAGTAGTGFDTSTSTNLVDAGALKNLRSLTILNNTDSNASINQLDVAIDRINTERAGLGAVINRLNYAVDNLANVSLNTSESRSRIMDTDYAQATADMARALILNQAGTALLSQANQQPRLVLALLR